MALSLAAGVHLQTIQNWMSGKTTPRPHEMSKVAQALDKPMDHFMSIYEGRAPEAQPLHEAVAELTEAIRALIGEMREERGQAPTAPRAPEPSRRLTRAEREEAQRYQREAAEGLGGSAGRPRSRLRARHATEG